MKLLNSYDHKAQEWTERVRSGRNFAHTYLEKPAMYRKLPDLRNKTVLCIGCGSGEECDHLARLGAKKVIGIDLSKQLIAIARKSYPGVEFHVMDMKRLKLSRSSVDFVYSSLAMHYLRDWRPALRAIHTVLKPDGAFLFSTHHPAYWCGEIILRENGESRLLGYAKANDRLEKIWGDYFNSHRIEDVWFGNMAVSYYHLPLSKILNEIRESGFVVSDFVEPKPRLALKKISRDHYDLFSKIPLFMIIELQKSEMQKSQMLTSASSRPAKIARRG